MLICLLNLFHFWKPVWTTCDHKLRPWVFFPLSLLMVRICHKFITCTVLAPTAVTMVKQIFWGRPLIIAFCSCLWTSSPTVTVFCWRACVCVCLSGREISEEYKQQQRFLELCKSFLRQIESIISYKSLRLWLQNSCNTCDILQKKKYLNHFLHAVGDCFELFIFLRR